jgi:16S rRNA G527 N7-methylase RsmG
LRTAIRELQLGRRVRLEVRRLEGPSATGDFDVAMSRATFPPPEWLALAKQLVHPGGRVFVLGSRGLEVVPPDLELVYAVPYLGGQRWLFELKRST